MAARGLAALALAFVVSACGSDSTGPGLTGSFSGNVTGEQTKSLRGDAFFSFGSVSEPGAGFALLLLEGSALGNNDDFIVIGREQEGRPAVGTYQIADQNGTPTASQFIATWFPATGENIDGQFFSTGGSVTVTSSSSRRLRGTFEFDATGSMEGSTTQLDVSVTGSFDAVFVDENGNPVSRITDVRIRRAAAP